MLLCRGSHIYHRYGDGGQALPYNNCNLNGMKNLGGISNQLLLLGSVSCQLSTGFETQYCNSALKVFVDM